MVQIVWTRGLNQTGTYWRASDNDGFGNVVYGAPVVVTCRVQEQIDLIRTAQGEEVTSSHVAYIDQALTVNGYFALGDYLDELDPLLISGAAAKIIKTGRSPSFDATRVLHKIWLAADANFEFEGAAVVTFELREDGSFELREDGSFELRE